ncbi:PEGA domain-containing protein [Vibrio sp. JC009]|uniref:PEGA domain-containing protein n=1 Tax=Vibrio sp. JC009 TaxID=2912314 RepID=UPI0023B0429C|nr:PEGA domain-containing protein [Vibrio sp. JC009]WED23549.1 PEGA domain-containing protein [Vibrio sp. JC009]
MITRRIPALMLALTPFWSTVSIAADDVQQVDPVVAIDAKLDQKKADIDSVNTEYETESANLKRLQNEKDSLKREGSELEAKRNRSKSALDKQYSRLLDDPETDLTSFQKEYQAAWASVKENQSHQLTNSQDITESEMRLSQVKQKKARYSNEYENLKEARIEARVKRIGAELRESDVLESSYTTTCSTTMTLGECASQGKYLTKQKAVKTFKSKLLASLTESNLAKQNLDGVQLNIHIQESQIIKSGFSGNNSYSTQMQAQLQAKPEATAACKLLNVESRYCLKGKSKSSSNKDKQWANVTVRSDQYNDSVTINGVKYGSTPVELVLPAGKHQVTVSKDGFETYNRVISINGNDTVWVKLLPSKKS